MSRRARGAGDARPATSRPALQALSDRLGILPGYRSTRGRSEWTSDATREALVAAMGFDGSSEAGADAGLRALDARERARPLAPVCVLIAGSRRARRVRVRAARGERPERYRIELREENGSVHCAEGKLPTRAGAFIELPLPCQPAPGTHGLELALEHADGRSVQGSQAWIVAPPRCLEPAELPGAERAFGLMCHLYALRGGDDWGAGDLGQLDRLVDLCGETGADFVGLNPLHALWNRGDDVSPYLPVSRLFRNPLYLEIAAVPELAECEAARALVGSREGVAERARLAGLARVDYAGVARAKRPVLELLHRCFRERHGERRTARGLAYRRYQAEQGSALLDHATFVALAEHLGDGEPRADWTRWPAELSSPSAPGVAAFRGAHADTVDFHAWLQFELDRQLGELSARTRQRGLSIGLYTDLALGSAAAGSDTWAHPGLFTSGANVGAPPDDFAPDGQDWSLPALDPHRLRESGYAFWSRLLRSGFAHAGALRLDHAMALGRLFWIPQGRPASEGAYVAYPESDLLGILCLESRRAGALVIGEDLGTVPAGLASRLARRGVLSSRVLYFERQRDAFRPARAYSGRALVSANTHDLPTLAGFLGGDDLRLRRQVGLIASDAELDSALAERTRTLSALCRRLVAEGLLAAAEPLPEPDAFAAAATAFLCRTPAPLVGLALDDLVGESEAVNLPGASQARHPSWARRQCVGVEQLTAHTLARRLLAFAKRERERSR